MYKDITNLRKTRFAIKTLYNNLAPYIEEYRGNRDFYASEVGFSHNELKCRCVENDKDDNLNVNSQKDVITIKVSKSGKISIVCSPLAIITEQDMTTAQVIEFCEDIEEKLKALK